MPARAGLTLTLNSTPDKSYNRPTIHDYRMLARGLLHLRAMNTQRYPTSRGFSLVELLIVCAVIGLIAAIAIPNLVNAIQRGRQARTVGDLRGLATAVAMYQQDYAKFPLASSWAIIDDIEDSVRAYMGSMSKTDGWRRSFMYISDGDNYTLVSYGMNGTADQPWTQGPIHYFDDDIIIQGGSFMQWPEGVQQ
jgi:prepilin-type N-terminal cleavage/methylation domain-containing protein